MARNKPDPLGALFRWLTGRDRLPGGRADRVADSAFDPEQLRRGTLVELEHTSDRRLAREIARDHLAESPLYYVRLAKMERTLSRKKVRRDRH